MRNVFVFLCLVSVLFACSDSEELTWVSPQATDNHSSQFERLNFTSEQALESAIEAGVFSNASFPTKSTGSKKFISLMDKMPGTKGISDEELTYYEALAYDTLVPNQNFASLLNPLGELEVGSEVIRITPLGTYKYPIDSAASFNEFITLNPTYTGQPVNENVYKINDYITLYKTFEIQPDDYELVSEGEYEELPDDFFGDNDDPLSRNLQTKAISEPDFNSFQTFSADRKTWIGKIIQNIIGSTKESTVKFSKKRQVKGSFYFYNYGVYSEIGVQGWTDKKNWIGWSKTASDELRVGWNQVVLKKTVPDYYKTSLSDLNNIVYYPPQYMNVEGQRVNVVTLAMPDFKATLKDKVIAQGTKALYNYLRNELKRPASEWEKAQAFIVATRTELYYISSPQNVVKYNTKSYTHVFAKSWMQFEVGWSNKNGFFINKVNQNNANKITPWLNTIAQAFNEKKTTLVGGEVYICARFGNEWRGMKIVKK